MSRTVYLHIGIAKTGTTYLQRTLYANRRLLERHGTRYPGPGSAAHFFASLDLRGTTFKGHVYDRVDGAWGRLVAQADGFKADTLISHETLAHAKSDQIERAVTSFATDDVRIVITCRDLARQIPAVWQERLKNRNQTSYDKFLAQVFATWRRDAPREGGFWVAQDIGGLVTRWSAVVGPERVCIVTVPPPSADRMELWHRFAKATNLPDLDYAFPQRDNSSLGVGEAELLRRLNPLLTDTLDWPRYDALIKWRLAERILGPLDSYGRLRLPPRWRDEVADISASEVALLESSGVPVIGDLHDLIPGPDDAEARQPDALSDSELLDLALEVLAVLAADPKRGLRSYEEEVRNLMSVTYVKDAVRIRMDALRRRLRGKIG